MIGSRFTPRAAGNCTVVAFAILTIGCKDEISRSNWDADLPPGVSEDPATFQQTMGTIVPVVPGHVRTREATCPQCTVEVSIQAIYNTRSIKPDSAPATGVAVARLQNQDSTKIEKYYGLLPSAQATYYFWVDKRPDSDSARITLLEVPNSGGTVRAGHQKKLGYCHMHAPGYAGPPDADFLEYKGPCTVVAATPAKIKTASVFAPGRLGNMVERIVAMFQDTALAGASQGGWIDCNSGCCR